MAWSGGKDSTASIILAHENNEPLDTIVFAEVMFDRENEISGENPRHIDFIKNTAKPLFESWGYQVEILRAQRDYIGFFNRIVEKPTKHIEHKGMKVGFPLYGMCGIQRDCKTKPVNDFYKSINDELTQYVGICADETKRLEILHKQKNRISLLEKYGVTEAVAKQKCVEYGLLSPCYDLSKRGGCWFCPNAKLAEQKEMKRLYPDVWRRFVEMENTENITHAKFNPFGASLHEIDETLKWDEAQMDIFDFIK